MNFALTEEQQMLKSVARNWLTNHCTGTFVREMEIDGRGYAPEHWKEMANSGWLGILIPEKYGGTGMGFFDQVVLLEEMGRACFPGPYLPTSVLAVSTILAAGNEEQKAVFLSQIARGDLVATLALTEPDASWDTDAVKLSAVPHREYIVLNGVKLFVPDAHVSGLLIVAAVVENELSLFLLDGPDAGLSISIIPTIAGDKHYEVTFEDVYVHRSRTLGELGQGSAALKEVLQKGSVAKCAESVGGAEKVLEMTVQYSKDRVQFGHPIGSFQAIQQHCADMAIEFECSRFITYQAAWRISQGLRAVKEVAVAKAWTSESYRRITSLAQQVCGAIAFTSEHDMQLYFRRAKAAEVMFGDAGYHREQVAREMDIPVQAG